MLRRTILAISVMMSASAAFVPAHAQDCDVAGTVGSGGSAAAKHLSSTSGTAGSMQTDDDDIVDRRRRKRKQPARKGKRARRR